MLAPFHKYLLLADIRVQTNVVSWVLIFIFFCRQLYLDWEPRLARVMGHPCGYLHKCQIGGLKGVLGVQQVKCQAQIEVCWPFQLIMLSKFHADWTEIVAPRMFIRFSHNSNKSFYPIWPSFELNLDFIKTNIMAKFYEDCPKIMGPWYVHKVFRFELVF